MPFTVLNLNVAVLLNGHLVNSNATMIWASIYHLVLDQHLVLLDTLAIAGMQNDHEEWFEYVPMDVSRAVHGDIVVQI
jgi:hypothetical protein